MTTQTATPFAIEANNALLAIVTAGKTFASGGKGLAASVRAAVQLPEYIGRPATFCEVLQAVRRELLAIADTEAGDTEGAQRKGLRKPFVDAAAYAVKVAGGEYGVTFKWLDNSYQVQEKAAPAAGPTVAGQGPAISEEEARAESKAGAGKAFATAVRNALAFASVEELQSMLIETAKAVAIAEAAEQLEAQEKAAAEADKLEAQIAEAAEQLAKLKKAAAGSQSPAPTTEPKAPTAAAVVALVNKAPKKRASK